MTNTVHSVWRKVERRGPDECWPWIGKNVGDDGRGRLDIQNVEGVYAPRAAYLSANPECGMTLRVEDGRHVLHRCDNPACCNPRHLFVGSHKDNMADKKAKGRSKIWARSTETPRAKLTDEDVFFMRLQKKMGATKKALALLYEASEATVSGALYGRHYRDVPSCRT